MNNPQSPFQPPFIPAASPSTWLGVMGGGQLGRMFTHAAQAMGFKVTVLEPVRNCPAGHAADHLLCANYTDMAALTEMAEQCVAITTEFENVPAQSLAFLASRTFVAPSADCVSIAQDRIAEKRFFTECAPQSGVLPAPHLLIETDDDISHIPDVLLPDKLKTTHLSYDGKGQVKVKTIEDARAALTNKNKNTNKQEKKQPQTNEVSV